MVKGWQDGRVYGELLRYRAGEHPIRSAYPTYSVKDVNTGLMMDRSLYRHYFTDTNTPDWMCPTCKKGILRIVEKSFNKIETRDSRQAHSHPNWEPCFTTYIYSCLLRCHNERCQEIVANTGTGSADIEGFYNERGQPDQEWVNHFYPTFFEPPLAIIDIPADCPAEVKEPLQESFRLFFCSPSSAGNNVRMAMESLLTQLDVPIQVTTPKIRRLNLYDRIQLLPDEHSEFKTLFNAIRLFGNDGSHPNSKITSEDMKDAYELIEHVLQVLYKPVPKLPTEIVEKITKKFTPKPGS
ncbi:DUF4145 domain-containing protein [Aeromonas caviae]|uniref:DUF4145 domain-containing protein n=1 Tax=Aeromonas caviae TaxID=648 RepID=UPI002B491B9E|nr:DUF4145 domain-containing protein [Aeromonas caviae]